jgi:tyrosine-protein kinase Etk/Wzc
MKISQHEIESNAEELLRPGRDTERIHFLEPLIVLAKWKSLLLWMTLGAGLVSAIVSLLLPPIYTGTVRIMPPQQSQSIASSILGQFGPLASIAGRDLGLHNPGDLYIAMLRSRTVGDELIADFSLMEVYKSRLHVDAERQLEAATDISAGKEGVISVSVKDRNPQRAADLANAYVVKIQKLTQTLAITEAGRRRLFFEGEVLKANRDLATAEFALKKTQENTGIIQLDSQAKAVIEAVSSLRAQIASKEAQVQAMSAFAAAENPELVRAQHELAAFRSELSRFEGGQGGNMSLSKVPEAGLAYVRDVRDVKYREALLELLTKQYEIARIDEGKDALIIQVLDKAHRPEVRSWPHRSIIVLCGTLLAFFSSIVCAFIVEALGNAKNDPQFVARWQLLTFHLKHRRKG